jgi:hypothetical protein
VQPDRRAIIGLEPHELPAAVGGGERVAGEGGSHLARGVGAAHVGIAIIDADDPPSQSGLERLAGSFRLGELWHFV